MSRRQDPRKIPGSIVGPGGPQDRHGVVIDAANALLFDGVNVAVVEPYRDGEPGDPIVAISVSGRINHTDDRVEVVLLTDVDGVAALVTELVGIAKRGQFGADLDVAIAARFAAMRDDGAL